MTREFVQHVCIYKQSFYFEAKSITPELDSTINVTAMIKPAIKLISLIIDIVQLMLFGNEFFFFGLPVR